MAMGRVWGGDPIPRPRPVISAPSPPQYEFSLLFLLLLFSVSLFFWLNYMKQKNSISMTTINLLVNQFATNQFTIINLHEQQFMFKYLKK